MITLGVAVALAISAIACGGTATSPTTVSSVSVTGTVPAIGETSQFKAIATMSDGTSQDVTTQATWQSSNSAIATVSAAGVVTAIAEGVVSVQATYQAVSGSDQITVVE